MTHLTKQFNIRKPQLVVLMGAIAALGVLGIKFSVEMHGTIIEKEGRKYFITIHPAAQFHSPKYKGILDEDFANLKKIIERKK